MSLTRCSSCGISFSDPTAGTCPYCGAPVTEQDDQQTISIPTGCSQASAAPPLSLGGNVGSGSSISLPPSQQRKNLRTFFKRRSRSVVQVEGVITHVQTQQDEQRASSFPGSLLALLGEIVGLARTSAQPRTVTVVRLLTPQGTHHDARLAGEARGALLVVGDTVSFTGRYWRGLLIVQRGFNQTSQAEIYSNARRTSLLSSLISLLVILVIFFIAWFWISHSLLQHIP